LPGVQGLWALSVVTALPRWDTGFVYRNEIVNHIRGPGTIDAAWGATRDARLQVVGVDDFCAIDG